LALLGFLMLAGCQWLGPHLAAVLTFVAASMFACRQPAIGQFAICQFARAIARLLL
jgi:hypothetical protein